MTFASENFSTMSHRPAVGSRAEVYLPRLMRKHLPTGSVTEAEWTAHHHWMLGDPQGYPSRALQKVCDGLVAKWNMQQPDTWQYWLE